jgi:hypothetical protein
MSGNFSGYYLCGSQLDNSANKNSDIDLILVVDKDVSEADQKCFDILYEKLYALHIPPIGIQVTDVRNVQTLPAYAKTAKLIYGKDLFSAIPLEEPEQTLKTYIHGSYRFIYMFLRKAEVALSYPVDIPDCADELLGYQLEKKSYGVCVKMLVSAVARISGALLVQKTAFQPRSKRECIEKYAELTGGEFSAFVSDVYKTLAREWQYKLPGNIESVTKFKNILKRFNDFENHFLQQIRAYMLQQSEQDAEWYKSCNSMIKLFGDS